MTNAMNEMNETALVIGATGSFGGAVMQEMLGRGWQVRALVRDVEQAREQMGDHARLEWVAGDALVAADVERAAQGCGYIVHGFNVSYEDWDPVVLDAARIVGDAAAKNEATILFPGNVYGLGPDYEEPLAEDAPHEPQSRKGELRNRLEAMLAEATERGAQVVIVRCGDFFGPTTEGWFHQIVDKAVDGGAIRYPGPLDVVHEWAYLPDVARVSVDLAERADELADFEVFHFEGHQVDGRAFTAAIRKALGDPNRPIKGFPWWLLTLASPFVGFLRELKEMRYLWQEPVRLDGSKLRDLLGDYCATPLTEAVATTLRARYPEAHRELVHAY